MPAAAGFAHFQAIAEWKTLYKGYAPDAQLVDAYARFVTDRWVYLIAATAMPQGADQRSYADAEVIREYYVDDQGKLWATTQDTPYAPIARRGDPVRATGVGYPGGLFPMLSPDGNAVWSWLVLSPFQLPASTIEALDSTALFTEISRRVPALWDWHRTSMVRPDEAALTSKDGWSLVETPLWLSQPESGPYASYGRIVRVAVGLDPFAVATERSRAYVDCYRTYQEELEPLGPTPSGEYQRLALAQQLDEIVVSNDRAREKFGKYIDIGRLNEELTAHQSKRRRLIEKYEQAAARVSEVMLSPLFGAFVDGAMDTEGVDDGASSPRLETALTVLARCVRSIGSSKSGAALMRMWAMLSEQDEGHFTNRIILPTVDEPPQSHVRTFRWGSKAIASILVQYVSHKVAVARIQTHGQIRKSLLAPLAKLTGRGEVAEIGYMLDKAIEKAHIKPRWFFLDTGAIGEVELQTARLNERHVQLLHDWVDEGAATHFGRDAKLVATKTLLAAVLDTINLALACQAAREKIEQGKWPGRLGVASMSAHALNLSATVVEACAAEYQLSTAWATHVRSAISGVRAVASAVFAVSNVHSAVVAYEKHDYSVSAAMAVAALSEATSAGAFIYTAVVSSSVAGPWVMLAASVVTAAAYIVATWTKDEPLEVFLENCEFGRDPYGDGDYRPPWADLSIERWRGEYVMQQRLLMRIIGRFTVSQASRGNSIVGIKVELTNFTAASVLKIIFEAEYADRKPDSETMESTGDRLPRELPGTVLLGTPSKIWNNEDSRPASLVAIVRFSLLPGSQAEELRFPLVVNGKEVITDPMSSVE